MAFVKVTDYYVTKSQVVTKDHTFPSYLEFMHEGHRYKQQPSKYLLIYLDINMFLFQSILSNIDNPGFNLLFFVIFNYSHIQMQYSENTSNTI